MAPSARGADISISADLGAVRGVAAPRLAIITMTARALVVTALVK